MLPALLCALVSAAALCGAEAAATSLLRRAPRQQQLSGGDAEYSIGLIGKNRGLHELSVVGALSGDHYQSSVARSRSPIILAWPAFHAQVARASGLACAPELHADPGARSATTGDCVRWLSAALEAGVVEPDRLTCPDVPLRAQMERQAAYAKRGAHNPLCACRTAVQVWHASPLPLVRAASYLAPGRRLPDARLLPPNDIQVVEKRAPGALLVSPLDNRQARTAVVATIVNAVAEAALRSELKLSARMLGAALHALGDSYSASHTRRADTDWTPVRSFLVSQEACARDNAHGDGGEPLRQLYSMDVVRWLSHRAADTDATSAEGEPLFRCAKFAIDALIAAWMRARAAPPSREALNRLVRESAEITCLALHMAPEALALPAGGATGRWSSANSAMRKLLAPIGGFLSKNPITGQPWSSAAAPLFQSQSFMPAALMEDADFAAHAARLDDDTVAFRAGRKTAAARNRVPERLWLPPRGWDACAAPEALAYDEAEYAAAHARGQLPAGEDDTYLTLAGRVRPFMLRTLGEPVAAGSTRWLAAQQRLDTCETDV